MLLIKGAHSYMKKLKKGVHLHIIPTQKFKTIRIIVRFTSPMNAANATKRTLLSSLMETNSLHYPDLTDISHELSELYGASFGINVSCKGNQHYFSLNMTIVNEAFLNQSNDLLERTVTFLKEILFYPNIQNGSFDLPTFQREKENLKNYYASIFDDKQTYASLALQELYFESSDEQKIPSFGVLSELEKEDAKSMATYYTRMLQEDQVDILISGDIDSGAVEQLFAQLPFKDRTSENKPQIFYEQPITNIFSEKQEQQPLMQSKLNLGYHTGIYFHDENYFSLQVFNGLLGGFPHSKLFMNVREKESMAYYASSSIDTFRGFLSVQTGIDRNNRKRVLQLIHEQITALMHGNFSESELEQTKKMLKNQYLLSLDNNQAMIEQAFLIQQVPQANLSKEEWIKRIDLVTKDDVKQIAKTIKLQALYFLEGKEEE